MVNRLCRRHFGQGLVATTDNFAALGERPVNRRSWMAGAAVRRRRLVDQEIHRLIMLSSTYQMGADYDSIGRVDPENRLLWRFSPRRLEAEPIRDALLAVGGMLDPAMGASLLQVKNREYFFDHTSKDLTDYDSRSARLPADCPQSYVRRFRSLRLLRLRRPEREPGDDDRGPAGLVHDEQRSGRGGVAGTR